MEGQNYLNNTTTTIQLRRLGSTEILITPIGLGVMQLSGGKRPFNFAFPNISQAQADVIVAAALQGGINWFDTAEMYGLGQSERALAHGLQQAGKTNHEVVIATKWLPLLRTAANLKNSLVKRFDALAPYPIDLYQIHQPWSFSSPEAEMDAMADLVEAGMIKAVGVSNFDARRMERAYRALEKRGLRLASNQMPYSLLTRGIEKDGVLQLAKDLGVTIIAYTPLEYGLLTGKLHHDPSLLDAKTLLRRGQLRAALARTRPLIDELERLAEKYGATAGQVALNWLMHAHGETVVAIPGASRPEHAAESAGAMRFRLSEEEIVRLGDVSASLPPD